MIVPGQVEAITEALFTLVSSAVFASPLGVNNATTWQNNMAYARRLALFGDVPAASQPAMYLVSHDEDEIQQGRGIPETKILKYSVVCYARAELGPPPTIGDMVLNVMRDAVLAAIKPAGRDTPDNVQTLGGLVYKCWVKGKIYRDPGDLDCQAMLIIPIEIMVP